MITVNLFDSNFIHTLDMCGYITNTFTTKPKQITWLNGLMEYDGITVFTDSKIFDPIVDKVKSRLKIAWLVEPPAIDPTIYANIIHIEHKFDYILTFDPNLLRRGKKYLKYIVGQSRVDDKFTGPREKTKKISLISSGKQMSYGHRFRADIVNSLYKKHKFDLWGYAYRPFNDKIEPLGDYEFSIAVMNSKLDNYFTEVLLDCFRLRTVPIFWGCPNIGDYFDTSGMEIFNTIEELDYILTNLKPYSHYSPAIPCNLNLASKYVITDDYIANILENL